MAVTDKVQSVTEALPGKCLGGRCDLTSRNLLLVLHKLDLLTDRLLQHKPIPLAVLLRVSVCF